MSLVVLSSSIQSCPHCSYISNNSVDGSVDVEHPCHNCDYPVSHEYWHTGDCDHDYGEDVIECPHCGTRNYNAEILDFRGMEPSPECRECGYPDDHFENHDTNPDHIICPSCNLSTDKNKPCKHCNNLHNNKLYSDSWGFDIEARKEKLLTIAKKLWNPQSDITLDDYKNKIEQEINVVLAAGPPNFEPGKEYPSGLPRPQWRTEKSTQHYNTETYKLPNNGAVSPGDRRLYQKVPVPWNTHDISEDIPQFDKDWVGSGWNEISDILRDQDHPDKDSHVENILHDTSESYRDRKCPMCGGKFENDDPAVLYTGSTIRETLSDWLPYHPHCMDLINKHCPHLRRESDSPGTQNYDNLYEHGTYGDLRKNGIQSYLKYIAGWNHRIAVKPPDFINRPDDDGYYDWFSR